jgi:hypothetical protein
MPIDQGRGSFGSRRSSENDRSEKPTADETPTPVLHVGEVHADLRLHLTDETLHELGSQIASMIANATAEGFTAGMAEGLRRVDDFDSGPAPWPKPTETALTDEDIRRARGE